MLDYFQEAEDAFYAHVAPAFVRAATKGTIMSYQEKDQSGTLFRNQRKEREAQPDWTGKAIINGTPVYVSGWDKDGRISLAFKNRQEGALEKKPEPRQMGGNIGPDDEIPFAPCF